VERVPAVVMRGGTSRAVFFHERDLPDDRADWDRVLLGVMGSPDRRQIDGLGGATSSTSKVAIAAPGTGDVDIVFTFAQVGIDQAHVDYRSTCGNISSAVAPFAVDEGLVGTAGDRAVVRIFNTNTGRVVHADVAVDGGRFQPEGEYAIDGVPGTGSRIVLTYLDPAGSSTGTTTPTGSVRDVLAVPGLGDVEASIIDVTSLYVFVRANDLGLDGTEEPTELNARPDLLAAIESVRAAATILVGLASDPAEAARLPTLPRIVLVGPAAANDGASDSDLAALSVSMGRIHQTIPVTAAMCAAAARWLPGSLVAEQAGSGASSDALLIRHPMGTIEVSADVRVQGDSIDVVSVTSSRTARRLMEGHVFVP
jgi:2-methylaconitate isomerase